MRPHAAIAALLVLGWSGPAAAGDRPLEELPRDAVRLAFVWTEPLKSAANEIRRFDPVSGLWFGLLEGSVKSVERTANYFLPSEQDESGGATFKPGKALLRYSF